MTVAERAPDPADYPNADPSVLVPGSLVFHPTPGAWWHYVAGASWQCPEGPASDAFSRGRHPVVHVAYEDAVAYAGWAGKALPTEAEWEYAARGGLDGAVFCWGDEFMPDGRLMANTWHGEFPHHHTQPDEWTRTSPVGTYPPNGYGLHDMAGNVWEWTTDVYNQPDDRCCAPSRNEQIPRRVIKGGSHLCAANYCVRYRPAARQGEAVDTSIGHIGFRCVLRGRARRCFQ